MSNGKFVTTGGPELALKLEEKGYDWIEDKSQQTSEVQTMSDTGRNNNIANLNADYATKYGFKDPVEYFHKGAKGINHEVVEMISQMKKEPDWMNKIRHDALDLFLSKPNPGWGNTELIDKIDYDDIYYFMRPIDSQKHDWDDVPEYIKKTFHIN